MGPSWRHLAKPWGPETLILLWFLQHLRSIDDLAPIFCSVSAILTYLSRSWAILAPSWAILGPSLAILGRLGAHLWAILGRLGAILGHLGAVLGPSWGRYGPSWGHLGAIFRTSRPPAPKSRQPPAAKPRPHLKLLYVPETGQHHSRNRGAAGPFAQRNSIRPHSVRSCMGPSQTREASKLQNPKPQKPSW